MDRPAKAAAEDEWQTPGGPDFDCVSYAQIMRSSLQQDLAAILR